MRKRKLWARSALFCILSALALVAAASPAAADSVTNIGSFSDPRSDLDNGRPGQLTRGLYGPYTIPAKSGTTLGQYHPLPPPFQPADLAQAPCTNCRITDMVPNLVYSTDGVNPTGVANLNTGPMLHHFVFFDNTQPDQGCPGGVQGAVGNRFFAAGNERSHLHLPSNYGYSNTNANWTILPHLVNTSTTAKTVYVEMIFKWRPTSAGDTRPATPVWLDIDGCGDSEYSAPVGYSDSHSDWSSTLSGYVLAIGGHMHDLDVTSPNPADRCEVHCSADAGEPRAVSAEVVGGPSGDYYGPSPPNAPPHVPGATICRSEHNHSTSFGTSQGFLGHLDGMTGCGIFGDPTTRQPEAYPLAGAYESPGYHIKQGQTIRIHSEYDNLTSQAQNDVMGIMQMWVGQANYARPQAGAQFRVPLVVAFNECAPGVGNNRTHGPSLTASSCNPSAQKSSFLTVGTLDANSFNSSSVGYAKITTCPNGTVAGTCSTPAGMSAPDVRMELSTTDVRCKAGVVTCEGGLNSDYTGELRASLGLRITDKHNSTTAGGTGDDGTTTAVSIPITATCAANGAGGSPTAIGGTCGVLTRANAVTPGSVPAAKRSNWEIARVDVVDGGSDGDVDTAGNTVFGTQGIFIP